MVAQAGLAQTNANRPINTPENNFCAMALTVTHPIIVGYVVHDKMNSII